MIFWEDVEDIRMWRDKTVVEAGVDDSEDGWWYAVVSDEDKSSAIGWITEEIKRLTEIKDKLLNEIE